MTRILSFSLLLQLLLIAALLVFGWQADHAMDKSGVGDLEAWSYFSFISGITFYGVAFIWVASTVFAIVGKLFSSTQGKLAIFLPPITLVAGWCVSWFI